MSLFPKKWSVTLRTWCHCGVRGTKCIFILFVTVLFTLSLNVMKCDSYNCDLSFFFLLLFFFLSYLLLFFLSFFLFCGNLQSCGTYIFSKYSNITISAENFFCRIGNSIIKKTVSNYFCLRQHVAEDVINNVCLVFYKNPCYLIYVWVSSIKYIYIFQSIIFNNLWNIINILMLDFQFNQT